MHKLSFFLVLSVTISLKSSGVLMEESEVAQAFIKHELVPDVLSEAPTGYLYVLFPSGLEVNLGEEVLISDVNGYPTVFWESSDDEFYTLIMTDPDAPTREDPYAREFRHWLVVNVPGTRVEEGQTLTPFLHSNPENGLHRYTFIVYQQNGYTEFEESFDESFATMRGNFSTQSFAHKYDFDTPPLAGNFYQTQNF